MQIDHSKPLAITVFIFAALAANTVFANQWQDVKDKNGIHVQTRQLEGEKYKSFKGTTQVKASMDQLIAFMEDVPNMVNWSYNVVEAKYLNKKSTSHSTIYLIQKMPVVKDRDVALEVKKSALGNGRYLFTVKDDKEAQPVSKDYVRVPKFHGSYTFTPVKDGFIEIIFEASALPGGSIPSWLANAVVVDIPYKSLKDLKATDFTKYSGKNEFQLVE